MRNKNFLMLLLIALTISTTFFAGCKKDDDDDNTADVLCDGISTNAYLPINAGNKWTYTTSLNSTITLEVTSNTKVFDGKTYNVLIENDFAGSRNKYLRTDAQGNVYEYFESSESEGLFLPVNPTQGQTYDLPSNIKYVVSKRDTTLTGVNRCDYTGVLKYTADFDDGSYFQDEYFVKGIGKVYVRQTDLFIYTEKLNTVVLK
jgi:hypothetical protein